MPHTDNNTHSPQNQNQNHQVDASPIHVNFDLPQPVVTHTKKAQKLAKVTLFPQQGIPRERGDEVGAMTHADLGRRFNLDAHLEDGQPYGIYLIAGLGQAGDMWADGPSGGRGGRWIVDDGYCLSSMTGAGRRHCLRTR